MTAPVPTNEPLQARAGLTWTWTRAFTDYPASLWTLTYWFKQLAASGAKFSVAATASGDTFSVNVAAATTASKTAGDYSWSAIVTGGSSEAYEVDTGTLLILPRYDQDAALDDRSFARKRLALIETCLAGNATPDVWEYSIEGRSLKRYLPSELEKLRDKYVALVFAEDNAERRRNGYNAGRLVAKL